MRRFSATAARLIRGLVVCTTATSVGLAGPAFAAGSPGGNSSPASLQAQADVLAAQIQADGRNLERLAEAVDAAQIRSNQLAGRLSALRRAMVSTDADVAATRANLKDQAILSYIAGGQQLVGFQAGKALQDPSLTISYAEIVSQGQQLALKAYRASLRSQRLEEQQLVSAQRDAQNAFSELAANKTAAVQLVAQRRQTLADVKGQMAILVAAAQKAQLQAEQTAVRNNLSHTGQLPPAAPQQPTAPPTTARHTTGPPPTTARPIIPTTAPPTTAPPTTAPPTTRPAPPPGGNYPAPGSSTAVHFAYKQLGKPYQWAAAGPNSYDCSGLTMASWAAAGVSLPHLAQGQYDMTRHIPLNYALPGDLIFFGTPNNVGHVGIYIGNGNMIDAPTTGMVVSISSIYWTDLLGAGRV